MKFVALTISIFLVILGAYASRRYQTDTMQGMAQEVLSEQKEEGQSPTSTPRVTTHPETSQSPPGTLPASTPQTTISIFIYPGATIKTQTQTTLTLESSDDTDKITDWYKDKIKNMGANVKSFINTRANDKVMNKLVGANSELEVSVEISRDPGSSIVKISVLLTLL